MAESTKNKNFSFNAPLAGTIIIISFFLLFKGSLSQLISGGDCLEMEFFGSKINTCKENTTKETLDIEQQEISKFVQSLKSSIDSLEEVNNSLQIQLVTLESKLSDDNTAAMVMHSVDNILSKGQRDKYLKYSNKLPKSKVIE